MWELYHKEDWVQKNWFFWTVVLEKTLESFLDCKEIQLVLPKGNQSWIFIGRTDTEAEAPILRPLDVKSQLIWKRPWCWERLKAGGEGDDRGWDGWMASCTRWTWVWASSGRWCQTRKPGLLQSMRSQRVRHDWGTEQQQHLPVYLEFSSFKLYKMNLFTEKFQWTMQTLPVKTRHQIVLGVRWESVYQAYLPGSSPIGSREFKAGTALAREKKILFIY